MHRHTRKYTQEIHTYTYACQQGLRPSLGDVKSKDMSKLISKAWAQNQNDRPTASEMVEILNKVKIPSSVFTRIAKACKLRQIHCIRSALDTGENAYENGVICYATVSAAGQQV